MHGNKPLHKSPEILEIVSSEIFKSVIFRRVFENSWKTIRRFHVIFVVRLNRRKQSELGWLRYQVSQDFSITFWKKSVPLINKTGEVTGTLNCLSFGFVYYGIQGVLIKSEFLRVTIQKKLFFHMVSFIMAYKVVLTLSVDETLVCDHSNESYWAVLSLLSCTPFSNRFTFLLQKKKRRTA